MVEIILQHFKELYGQETEEVFRPSFILDLDEPVKDILKKESIQDILVCTACSKPRVVYAEKKVFKKEERIVLIEIEVKK